MTAELSPAIRPRAMLAAFHAMRAIAASDSSEARELLLASLGAASGSDARVERFLSMRRASRLRGVQEALDTVPAFWATLLADATGSTIERVLERTGRIACGEACGHSGRPNAPLLLALGATEAALAQRAAEAAAWPSRAGRVLASLTLELAIPLAESGLRGQAITRETGVCLLASAWRRLAPRHARALAAASLTNMPRHLEACPIFKLDVPEDEWACLKRLIGGACAEATS